MRDNEVVNRLQFVVYGKIDLNPKQHKDLAQNFVFMYTTKTGAFVYILPLLRSLSVTFEIYLIR